MDPREATVVIGDCRRFYSEELPHISLCYCTPSSFAAICWRDLSRKSAKADGGVGREMSGGLASLEQESPRRLVPLDSVRERLVRLNLYDDFPLHSGWVQGKQVGHEEAHVRFPGATLQAIIAACRDGRELS